MKRLFALLILAAGAITTHASPQLLGGLCMNPSGAWIPINGVASGSGLSSPQQYGLLGQNAGSWYGLQCDASGNLTPGGTAGGDLSGTYPNPTVIQVNGAAVPASKTVVGTNSSSQLIDATSSIGVLANSNSWTAANIFSVAGVASTPGVSITGLPFAGNGTTSTPQLYLNSGASAPTTWNTNGTQIGINAASGSTANFLDFHVNGAAAVFTVSAAGGVLAAATSSTFGQTSPLASVVGISGGIATSAASTGTGRLFSVAAGTLNRTTDTGTVALSAANNFGIPTLVAGAATTYTATCTLCISGAPVASTNVTITNGYALDVVGGASIFNGALSATGAINLSGLTNANTGDYVCYNAGVIEYDATACAGSLERLKWNINPLHSALKEVLRLKPIEFRYRPEAHNSSGYQMHVGFIAEDVEQVDPRLAAYRKNGELEGVDYAHVTAVLTAAIQEQQKMIRKLQREVAALQKKEGQSK